MSIKGDFISFTYNGIHSTDLGIVHVSSSDRYNDNLLPIFKDKTIEIPGAHGTYYFGSYYSNRTIDLNVAFDEVTEDGIRLMRQMFIDKKPHELIFDEEPYKIYYAIAKTPNISFVPFQNHDNELLDGTPRIYKGEGTFNFICCEPFAHCPWDRKYLTQYYYANFNRNDFEQGAIATETGENTNNLYRIRQISYFPQIGGQTLVLNTNFNYYKIFFYDVNQIKINSTSWLENEASYSTPLNTQYIRIVLTNKTSNVSDEDKITINDFSYVYIKSINSPDWYNPTWVKVIDNKTNEWNLSAHLLSTWDGFDNHTGSGPLITKLYNPGDVPTDFQLVIPFNSCKKIQYIKLHEDNIGYVKQLEINFDNLKIKSSYGNNESVHVCFDSKTELLQEWIRNDTIPNERGSYRNTGKIYNEALQSTEWFKIPNMDTIYVDNSWQPTSEWYLDIILKEGKTWNEPRPTLWYEYLYY